MFLNIFNIIITAFGFFSFFISILGMFFNVEPSSKGDFSRRNMAFLVFGIILISLGLASLYFSLDHADDPISDDSISDDPFSDDSISDDSISDDTFDSAKFIKDNYDLIQKLKASYSEVDTKIIENDEVGFHIIEKAGIIYRNLNKTGKSYFLVGTDVVSAKVFILDYFSDDVLYTCASLKDTVRYAPGNHDKFYCVMVHSDYDLYVTPPIQAVGGTSSSDVDIYLDKKDVTYTPLSQIRMYMKDSKSNESYYTIPSDYIIKFCCVGLNGKSGNTSYKANKTSDSGLLSFAGCGYFSLNTDYELDISLYHQSDEYFELTHQTFDGFTLDSNIAEIIFELDNKNDTSE